MARGNEEFWLSLNEIVRSNPEEYFSVEKSSSINLRYADSSINLIVTSPPYVTSYEYADLHQLTAFLFHYTENLRDFKTGFIGSLARKTKNSCKLQSNLGKSLIQELKSKSMPLGKKVETYFLDMQLSFQEMYRVLKQRGKVCIVIGNTSLKQTKIKNAEVFVELLRSIGFSIINIIKREIVSKILPQTRDQKSGRFTSSKEATNVAYPHEFILIFQK